MNIINFRRSSMFNDTLIEWIGYLASILITISMFMKEIFKLRFINLMGCILFVIYGLIIGAYPVAIANAIIVFINLYYLYKLFREMNTKNNI
ncbi:MULTISPECIES: YgjV family protein [Clostridium]|uniref:YgjV family protein n=2 Tax=Clostridium sulfidigenes TaxID=318464 RepID=A0A927ZJF5_9CLOT|nr:YgjV family protein [Clostridium sulfidigenes]HAR86281.1 lactate dehydrogenase [Clostridium sp.]HBA03249.1 lactate dehydrogenase [Clostridium sp.]